MPSTEQHQIYGWIDANKLKTLWRYHQQKCWTLAPQLSIVACPWDDLIEDIVDCFVMQFIISPLPEKCGQNQVANLWESLMERLIYCAQSETEGKSFSPVSYSSIFGKNLPGNILLHFIHALNLLRFPFQVASLHISWEVFIERFKLRYCPQSEGFRGKWRKTQRSAPNHSPPPFHSPNRNPTTLAQTDCISFEIHSWNSCASWNSVPNHSPLCFFPNLHTPQTSTTGWFFGLVSKSRFCLLYC